MSMVFKSSKATSLRRTTHTPVLAIPLLKNKIEEVIQPVFQDLLVPRKEEPFDLEVEKLRSQKEQ